MAQYTLTDNLTCAPLEIWEVMLDNTTIKFYVPLNVQPKILDRGTTAECYCVEVEKLGLSAVAADLDELASCLRSDIRLTWKHIVQKQDNELTPDDLAIKKQFLEIAEEING